MPAARGDLFRPLFLIALCGSLTAQANRHVERLATARPASGTYLAVHAMQHGPTGRDIACLVERAVIWVLDVEEPRSPIVLANVPFAAFGFQPASAFAAVGDGRFLYGVSGSDGGLLVLDLLDPVHPVVATVTPLPGWSGAGAIARDGGLLCVAGAGQGLVAFDVASDPARPRRVATHSVIADDVWLHDRVAWSIGSGVLHATDMTATGGPTALGSLAVPGCVALGGSLDEELLAVATSGGDLVVVDRSVPAAPTITATLALGAAGVAVHIADRLAHLALASGGYAVVDLSDPSNPLDVGRFAAGNGGTVDVTADLASGFVHVCDASDGLVALHARACDHEYGTPTPGTASAFPTIHARGAAWLGNSAFAMVARGAPANAPAWFFISHGPMDWTFFGIRVLVDTVNVPGAVLPAVTDAAGVAVTHQPVPADLWRDGQVMFAQVLVADPGGPLGVTASAGVTFYLFRR